MSVEKFGFMLRLEFQGHPRFVRVDQVIAVEEHSGHTSVILAREGGQLHQVMVSNKADEISLAVNERLLAMAQAKLLEAADAAIVDTLDGRLAVIVRTQIEKELQPLIDRSLAMVAGEDSEEPAPAKKPKK